MHPALQKTFGGLSKAYYLRQFFFGLLLLGGFVFVSFNSTQGVPIGMTMMLVLSTFLYPYARFVYESVIGFIVGSNLFIVNAVFMLLAKFCTMVLCFVFAPFIAPVGLVYLYYRHSREQAAQTP